MSLRAFHILFIAIVIAGADLIGAWALLEYRTSGEAEMLLAGIVTLVGGLGLIAYGIWFMRKLDRANIH
ncbi:MAG TPA: hypothetical protein VJZ71_00290 [Phycisphaerae bacterium]|nr:hypothetical protein [Phycisphaerae bacterium]